MKKVNKAAAQEWQQEQKFAAALQEQFEDEKHLLWYAANKRKCNYPCPDVFRQAGYVEVAAKISQAYALLDDAYHMLERN